MIEKLSCKTYLVVLNKGDNLFQAISQFNEEILTPGHVGRINGIGALKDVKLGYLENGSYLIKEFKEDYEVLHLTGNISLKEGQYFTHLHTSISDNTYACYGGHLMDATVAVTMELFIDVYESNVTRKFDQETNIYLLNKGE